MITISSSGTLKFAKLPFLSFSTIAMLFSTGFIWLLGAVYSGTVVIERHITTIANLV